MRNKIFFFVAFALGVIATTLTSCAKEDQVEPPVVEVVVHDTVPEIDTVLIGKLDFLELRTLYSALYETGIQLKWEDINDLVKQSKYYTHHNISQSPLRYIIICGAINKNALSDDQCIDLDIADNCSGLFVDAQSVYKRAQRVNDELFGNYGIKDRYIQGIIEGSDYLQQLQREYPNESLFFYMSAVEQAADGFKFGAK